MAKHLNKIIYLICSATVLSSCAVSNTQTDAQSADIIEMPASESRSASGISRTAANSIHYTKMANCADAIIAASDYTDMMEIADDLTLQTMFDLYLTDYSAASRVIYEKNVGTEITEIIIIKADDMPAAVSLLEDRQSFLSEKFQNDPDHDTHSTQNEAIVSNAAIGSVNDYAYLIISPDAVNDEIILLDCLTEEGE